MPKAKENKGVAVGRVVPAVASAVLSATDMANRKTTRDALLTIELRAQSLVMSAMTELRKREAANKGTIRSIRRVTLIVDDEEFASVPGLLTITDKTSDRK